MLKKLPTCLKSTSRKATYNKMFGFVKKIFLITSLFLSILLSTTPLSCISMINQACKVRPEIINLNSNDAVFYTFSIKTNNVVLDVTISMIHMQKYVFLIL